MGHDPHGIQGETALEAVPPEIGDRVASRYDAAVGRQQQRLLAVEGRKLLGVALVRGLLVDLHEFGQFAARIRGVGASSTPTARADGQGRQQHHHGTRDCHSGRSLGSFSDVKVAVP